MSHVFLVRQGLLGIVGYTLSHLMECGHDFCRVLVGGYEWRRQHQIDAMAIIQGTRFEDSLRWPGPHIYLS